MFDFLVARFFFLISDTVSAAAAAATVMALTQPVVLMVAVVKVPFFQSALVLCAQMGMLQASNFALK